MLPYTSKDTDRSRECTLRSSCSSPACNRSHQDSSSCRPLPRRSANRTLFAGRIRDHSDRDNPHYTDRRHSMALPVPGGRATRTAPMRPSVPRCIGMSCFSSPQSLASSIRGSDCLPASFRRFSPPGVRGRPVDGSGSSRASPGRGRIRLDHLPAACAAKRLARMVWTFVSCSTAEVTVTEAAMRLTSWAASWRALSLSRRNFRPLTHEHR